MKWPYKVLSLYFTFHMGRTKKEKTRNLKENGNNREFKISQIPFAFDFECDRPNSNSVTVCHRIAIWPFDQFFSKSAEW